MSSQKHTLIDPIPAEGDKEITSVKLIKPRLKHMEAFALAIGPDVLNALIDGRKDNDGKSDETIDKATIQGLIKTLISEERFDLFNDAIAGYLNITKNDAEMLSLEDLYEIGVIVVGFFQGLSEKIATSFSDTLSDQEKPSLT